MLDIVGKRKIYYVISLLLILPGLISLALFGLKLSIEFTGGSRMTLVFPQEVTSKTVEEVRTTLSEENIAVGTIQPAENNLIIRTSQIDERQNARIIEQLREDVGAFRQETFETIGPTIGEETTQKAIYSLLLAFSLIVLYIALSFRKVPRPASSWRFGITAIIAVLHDVLIVVGLFSILGHFLNVEIDSLFITALLTVIGFSVHDTIVVFDRVRENLLRVTGVPFAKIVNDSILQTIVRSLNTSLTSLLVLLTMLLFGGESIRWFIVALLVGIAAGTYSSIFNASQLLVTWHEWDLRRKRKDRTQK